MAKKKPIARRTPPTERGGGEVRQDVGQLEEPLPNAAAPQEDQAPPGEPAAALPSQPTPPPAEPLGLDLSQEEEQALGIAPMMIVPTEEPQEGERTVLRLQGESDEFDPNEFHSGRVGLRSAPGPVRRSTSISLPDTHAPRAILGDALAFFDATRKGRDDVVRKILTNGVDPMLTDDPGGEHVEAIRFLMQNEDIGQQHVDGVKMGRTACHMAAARGHDDVLLVLIEAGADVNVTDHAGKTPLMLAAYGGYLESARRLLAAGARAVTKDMREGTALLAAARGRQAELVRELIQAGAEVDEADVTGETPLLVAAAAADGKVMIELLKAQPDVSRRDATGLDALGRVVTAVYPSEENSPSPYYAVPEEHLLPLVKLLLRAGAHNVPDAAGITPSARAQERGYLNLVALLEQHG